MVLLTVFITIRREKCYNILLHFVTVLIFIIVVKLMQNLQVFLVGIRHNLFINNFPKNPAFFRAFAIYHIPNFNILLLDVRIISLVKREMVSNESGKIDIELECEYIVIYS